MQLSDGQAIDQTHKGIAEHKGGNGDEEEAVFWTKDGGSFYFTGSAGQS